jgi:dihydrofolate reductase
MRKLIAAAFMSLDGVMQAPGGPEEDPTGGFALGGWSTSYWDDAMGAFMGKSFGQPHDFLLGRKTYEIFAAHWPYAPADDPVAVTLNTATKYVATRGSEPLTWANSHRLDGDVATAVARLKQQDGPDLLTQGSTELLQALLAHDLIDEFSLMIFPLILGPGKRLFGKGAKPAALKLTSTAVSSTGVIMNLYDRSGEISIGSFQHAQPSAAEAARRERMKREG